jgi:very-short-patch-repair endonuclease
MLRLLVQREIERDFVLPYNAKLVERSRKLRKHMTDTEIILWSKLRMKQLNGFRFYRQKPIDGYIADFFCMKAKLVIEIDGGQHFEEKAIEYDKKRDKKLKDIGLTILRFNNIDIKENIEGVIDVILDNLKSKSPLVPLYKRGKR